MSPAGVDGQVLHAVFDAIRAELDVPAEFPPEVLAEASEAVANPRLPERDETALPVLHRRPGGRRRTSTRRCSSSARTAATASATPSPTCRPACVAGGAIDRETRRRGQTIYAPDRSTPLHPETLSEDAASLLPGEARPAFVWDLRLDADGERRGRRGLPRDGAQRRADRLRGRAVGGRRRHRRRAAAAAQGGRGAPDRPGAGPRRREPADAGAGGDDAGRRATGSASGRRCRPRTGTPRSP